MYNILLYSGIALITSGVFIVYRFSDDDNALRQKTVFIKSKNES